MLEFVAPAAIFDRGLLFQTAARHCFSSSLENQELLYRGREKEKENEKERERVEDEFD